MTEAKKTPPASLTKEECTEDWSKLSPEEVERRLLIGYRSSTDGEPFKFVALDDLEDPGAEPD
jgi:hypothetical protein